MTARRAGAVIFGLLLVLGVANYLIVTREQILEQGRRVLLDINPSDPRSLVQGDYMRLRFDNRNFPPADQMKQYPHAGVVIMELDDKGVANFLRLDDGAALGDNQVRLRFKGRHRFGRLKYTADTFFFQEGLADRFAGAAFAVLRVMPDGMAVMQGLADEQGETIR